jgi:hypothetical protein
MKKLWILLLLFVAIACRDADNVREPENLIPENKMVEVLTDLSLLNSAKNYNRRQLESTGLRPIEYLYDRHGIDSVRLAQSTRYYANYPADLERIYNRVKNNLEILKKDLESIREEERKVKDTVLRLQRDGDSTYVNPEIFKRERKDTLPPGIEVENEERSQ